MKYLILALLLITFADSKEISKREALMGREVWTSFQCSIFATKTLDTLEHERLFDYGYDQGKKFLKAIQKAEIKSKDLGSAGSWGVFMALEGPTVDFRLGRIYENAKVEALKLIYKDEGKYASKDYQKAIAEKEYENTGCKDMGN